MTLICFTILKSMRIGIIFGAVKLKSFLIDMICHSNQLICHNFMEDRMNNVMTIKSYLRHRLVIRNKEVNYAK
jgi:hypothetical protein